MKKLKKIVNWTIWSLLSLYVAAVVLIHLPFVQRWLGSVVAGALSTQLQTDVSVGRIDLGLFNRLIIDDVNISDQRRQPLLHARRLSAKVALLPLFNGRIDISSAQLLGAELFLRRDSAAACPNYQFIVDALSSGSDDGPSALNLHIGSLIVRRLSLAYDQLDAPATPGRLNPCHLKVNDVSAHILLRTLTPDSLCINVKRLSLSELSGLQLHQLSFRAEANRQQARIDGFRLIMPETDVTIDSATATYHADSLLATLRYRAALGSSVISLADLRCLLPPSLPTNHTLRLQARVQGTAGSLQCDELHLDDADAEGRLLTLQASAAVSPRQWQAHLAQLHISDRLLQQVADSFPSLPTAITRMGSISITAQAQGTADGDMEAQGRIATAHGSLTAQADYDAATELWNAALSTDSLDVGQLTAQADLGIVSAQLQLHGTPRQFTVTGSLPRADLHQYSYRQLTLDGTYTAGTATGKLTIDDPNLQADVEGSLSHSQSQPHLRLTGFIARLAPQPLNLSNRWGEATFQAVVDADITATSVADAQGTLDLDDFTMSVNDSTSYHLDNLHLKAHYDDEQRRHVRLSSDFGEAQLSGAINWPTLPHFLTSAILGQQAHTTPAAASNFSLNLALSDSRWMQQLLGIQLDLDGPLKLKADIDEAQQRLDLQAEVPAFSYATGNYRSARLDLSHQADSTRCHAQLIRLTGKGKPIYIGIEATGKDATLNSALTLHNEGNNGGTVNTITRLYTNDRKQREAHVRVLPSLISMGDATWQLEPSDIVYSDRRLMVDHFTLHHDDEHFIVDGIASTQQHDSLIIDLQGIDVAKLLDLVGFRAVKFGGRATGQAVVGHAFSKPAAWADLAVSNFLFQQAHMGTLEAHVDWNGEEKQIDLEAAIDDGAEAQTYIDGFISPARKELDLGIRARGTTLAFVHSFTRSFINRIEGNIHGDVRLHGPLKQLDLSGEATVSGLAAISPLGTTYTFSGDTVTLSPGAIVFHQFHAYDRQHHEAQLTGAINHRHFKNFTFDLEATANRLLVYDFPIADPQATIGGTVWADGTALLRGRPGEVVIDCDATPTAGSVFFYNAANPDAINRQQFITWGEAKAPEAPPSAPEGATIVLAAKDESIKAPSGAVGGASGAPGTPGASASSDLYFNLRINATPDATLRLLMDQNSGDYITLNGTGALRANYYNKGPFQIFGTYNVERGIYSMTIQNILKKSFQFQPGSTLTFGGDPLQAALQLKALHTVNGVSLSDLGLGSSFTSNTIRVNCLMNILGTAGEPRVEFDLEMPTLNNEEEQMIRSIITSEQELNQQVVYLLGIGRFYTQGVNNAETQAYGQTELAMQSLLSGTVSSQINQLLTQVIKTDDWNFGANISTGNEGWHNAEYEGLVSGRMLNNRLLINGQFGYRDNATQATPSFIGDFDLRYLLTPSGSIALKAYNQTNDRYFTHSSLNTQGVGIILKKDFNGLGDLFGHRRRRAK